MNPEAAAHSPPQVPTVEFLLQRIQDLEARLTSIPSTQQFVGSIVQQALAATQEAKPPGAGISIRLKEPDTFSGGYKENVDRWLFEVEQYLRAANEHDDKRRVPIAAALLRGNALAWWEIIVNGNEKQGIDESLCSWSEFKANLTKAFRTVNREDHARDQLSKIQQKSSVSEYLVRFNAVILDIPGMSSDEKYNRFFEGLKPHLRQELVIKGKPKDYEDLVCEAERIDTVLFETSGRRNSSFKSNSKDKDKSKDSTTPMELGTMNSNNTKPKFSGKLTPELRKLLEDERRCRYCREVKCPGYPDPSNCPHLKAKHPNGQGQ